MKYQDAIEQLRYKMLLTKEEFAKMLNVFFGSLNRWKSGKYITKNKRQLAPLFE